MKEKNGSHFMKLIQFFKKLGPGVITGASDDDPSGIATYSQAGAQFGLATLWTGLLTFPLMMAMQEMCARIGLVTSEGLTANIKKNYPKPILWLIVVLTCPAIILNISANIASMGAVAHLVIPAISSIAFSIFIWSYCSGLILIILHIANRKKIMGKHTNADYQIF